MISLDIIVVYILLGVLVLIYKCFKQTDVFLYAGAFVWLCTIFTWPFVLYYDIRERKGDNNG